MKRRKFLKILTGAFFTAAALPAYASLIEPGMFSIEEHLIKLRRFGSGLHSLRAVQISDMHIGSWFTQTRLEQVISKVIDQKPELVFITGDYLTMHGNHPKMRRDLYDPLLELSKICTVFSVLGNHDLYDGLQDAFLKMLREIGIQDVTNTYATYQRGGDVLHIAGVGTLSTGHMGLVQVSRKVPKSATAILLAHEPDVAQWTREFPQFVLQLSGHTHGGQVVFPFSGPSILPWMGKMYPAGLYDLESMFIYTNRGLGMTRVPFRLNCPPEISVFTFTQATI